MENLLATDDLVRGGILSSAGGGPLGANEAAERQRNLDAAAVAGANGGGDDDDDVHLGGMMDDDYEMPCTAGTDGPAVFSQNGDCLTAADCPGGSDMHASMHELQPVRFDGSNLIEAPVQVDAINIEYAKQSKNIDVRRLKQVIWHLLNAHNDDKVNFFFN